MPETPNLIGTVEVAELLGIERSTITRWIKEGRMAPPELRVSGGRNAAMVFDRAVILKFRDDLMTLAAAAEAAELAG